MIVHKKKEIPFIKITTFFILVVALFVPFLVFAQGPSEDSGRDCENEICNPLNNDSLVGFLDGVVGVFVKFSIPIAAMAIIYSGFLFVTAQGSDAQISKAKKVFYFTIIGVTVLLGASVIISVIAETIRTL
jgi:hypothetical protein